MPVFIHKIGHKMLIHKMPDEKAGVLVFIH
jgi:hypothetical protein